MAISVRKIIYLLAQQTSFGLDDEITVRIIRRDDHGSRKAVSEQVSISYLKTAEELSLIIEEPDIVMKKDY